MAQSFTSIIMDFIDKYKFYAWMLLLVVLLFIGFLYVYRKNFNKLLNNKEIKNIPNSGSGNDVEIIMFTVDWCPHCKKAKSAWNDFVNGYNNKMIGTKHIYCKEINLTSKDQGDRGYEDYKKAEVIAKRYNIDGYPTIKMIDGDNVIDFDAKITTYALERFVEDML